MRVSIAYAEPDHQEWLELEVPVGTTAAEALDRSAIPERFPHGSFAGAELGIFGQPVPPDRELRPGDRVEIDRPLQTAPR